MISQTYQVSSARSTCSNRAGGDSKRLAVTTTGLSVASSRWSTGSRHGKVPSRPSRFGTSARTDVGCRLGFAEPTQLYCRCGSRPEMHRSETASVFPGKWYPKGGHDPYVKG
jgi:hypothetical protein